jgi:uncharacterized protein YndB with AHSA1/START domain
MNKTITIETTVHSDIETVWKCWNTPEDVKAWLHASDDWECTNIANDVQVGGHFSSTLGAKDKSASFTYSGAYTQIVKNKFIAYALDDGREVTVSFTAAPEGIHLVETFEMEHENPTEVQRTGWQTILDNFKAYAESHPVTK